MKVAINTEVSRKKIIKKCHVCGNINEANREVEKCGGCHKPFLPMNYFGKVHAKNSNEFKELFANATELHEEDTIKGLTVIW